MPLAGSGTISIGGSTSGRSVNLEFGRAAGATTSMSQLYRGGGIVPNASANNAIPTSGPIGLSQFYNATNRVSIPITISANETNYVLNTAKAAGYVAGISDIVLTINSGVYVSASSTGVPAMTIDTSWSAGDTVSIVNNGFIVGMGGAGGMGGGWSLSTPQAPVAGSGGGLALSVSRAVTINNVGTIAGGGGGGGGGGWAWVQYDTCTSNICTARTNRSRGGGGGGGRSSLTDSAGGALNPGSFSSFSSPSVQPQPGASGNTSSSGGGGVGSRDFHNSGNGSQGGAGGGGGGWGLSGASGGAGTYEQSPTGDFSAGASGGGAGAAVSGNANISWVATGTRIGAIA